MSFRILVFDSGGGGLTITRAILDQHPDCSITYAADLALFPYGNRSDEQLTDRIVSFIQAASQKSPFDLAVVACNTASTLALEILRRELKVPIIGVVPAIKPAASLSKSGHIMVFATHATIGRPYTQELIQQFAERKHVYLHGCEDLVTCAENKLKGAAVEVEKIQDSVQKALHGYENIALDVLVLACTHFPIIEDEIREAFAKMGRKDMRIIEPSDAIARRVTHWKASLNLRPSPEEAASVSFYLSGSRGATVTTESPTAESSPAKDYFAYLQNSVSSTLRLANIDYFES